MAEYVPVTDETGNVAQNDEGRVVLDRPQHVRPRTISNMSLDDFRRAMERSGVNHNPRPCRHGPSHWRGETVRYADGTQARFVLCNKCHPAPPQKVEQSVERVL